MAAIAAVQMQFPDPPPLAKGAESSAELRRRAAELHRSGLLKEDWDPAKHPRTGTPPNPGWFAPVQGGESQSPDVIPVSAADNKPGTRTPNTEDLPTGGGGGGGGIPRIWQPKPAPAAPSEPPASSPTELPGQPPRSLDSILAPGGEPIGAVSGGARPTIRTVSPEEFEAIQSDLLSGAIPVAGPPDYPGVVFERPDGSLIGIRESPQNGTTIDILRSTVPTIPNGFRIHQK